MLDRGAKLARIAERQFGVFSGQQAVGAGYPRSTIRGLRGRGAWVQLFGDTYRLAGTPEAWQQPVVAAYLCVGPPSAIGGRAALGMWGLADGCRTPELVVPWARRPRQDGFRITRTRRYTRAEMVRLGTVHVTSVARTLLDLAPRLPSDELEMALDAAHRTLLDLRAYLASLDGAVRARIPGAAHLRSLVRLRDPDRPIESDAETLLFAVLRRGGLPLPVPQYRIRTRSGRKRLDFAYPEHRLAIEVDSYEHHGSRPAFEADRARDNELADLRWSRRRITWRMLVDEPLEVQWTIGRALNHEPSGWRPSPRRRAGR